MSRPTGQSLVLCVAVASIALLSGCADEGGDDSAGAASDSGAGAAFQQGGQVTPERVASAGDALVDALAVTVDSLEVVKTGTVALESEDVDVLLAELDAVVARYGGVVEGEDVRTDDEGDAESAQVVVRVPVDRFEVAVDQIADLGTLIRERTSSEDVTARVADVDARVATAQRSIDSLQRLFDRATRLIDVIRLESELSQRQADLESLLAQQRSLARRTAMSTIHVSVDRTEGAPRGDGEAGFVDGLESGWSGLVSFVRGTVHVVGLILPLGTLALLVAAVGWFAVRRLRPAGRG